MQGTIYLDYAAATPMDPRVVKAMQPYFSVKFYNPSANYLVARSVRHDLEAARAKVAGLLGARPAEIIFTSGATESNNLAIRGVADSFPNAEIMVSSIEHESVLAPAERIDARTIPVSPRGIVDLDKLKMMITDSTILVSVMMVNNELGTIQPLREVAAIIKEIRVLRLKSNNHLPLYLHTDAAQAGNVLDLKVSRLGVDMMSLNGGKIYGPKQSGVLYVRTGVDLKPLIAGGGQEFGLRSGTENVAGSIGFAFALEIAQSQRPAEAKRLADLKEEFAKKLQNDIPLSVINGDLKHSSPHLLNVRLPGFDNERLMMELDEAGIQVATGSACSASNDEPSHVLRAIGLTDKAVQNSLRFSFGRQTEPLQVERVIKSLAALTERHQ